ncbi:MAG TPA: hypothetical protein VI520_04740, partial [Anaerolineales bacterium]|nr:hypothetical protein [Anaerolineales bacterium]
LQAASKPANPTSASDIRRRLISAPRNNLFWLEAQVSERAAAGLLPSGLPGRMDLPIRVH